MEARELRINLLIGKKKTAREQTRTDYIMVPGERLELSRLITGGF